MSSIMMNTRYNASLASRVRYVMWGFRRLLIVGLIAIMAIVYFVLSGYHANTAGSLGSELQPPSIQTNIQKLEAKQDAVASNFALVWTRFVQPNRHGLMRHQEL